MVEPYVATQTILAGGTLMVLARIRDWEAVNIVQAGILSGAYTVYDADPQDLQGRQPVTNHTGVALVIADVVFDTLQKDARWTVDATGYNFRHVIDVSVHAAFATPGKTYQVDYRLMSNGGQPILFRAEVSTI
jgi:hypothetical protein